MPSTTTSAPTLKVENYKVINKNTLMGAFDLYLPSGIVIYGVMYHLKGDSAWCAFPGRPYQKDGQTTYAKLIEIPDRERRDRFNAQVIAVLRDAGHI